MKRLLVIPAFALAGWAWPRCSFWFFDLTWQPEMTPLTLIAGAAGGAAIYAILPRS